jgi:hypothetical protein
MIPGARRCRKPHRFSFDVVVVACCGAEAAHVERLREDVREEFDERFGQLLVGWRTATAKSAKHA